MSVRCIPGQDARGSLCEENNGSLTEEIQQTCNVQVASGYGIVTHIYNLRHHLIPDTAVSFCTIMDYFGDAADRKKKKQWCMQAMEQSFGIL